MNLCKLSLPLDFYQETPCLDSDWRNSADKADAQAAAHWQLPVSGKFRPLIFDRAVTDNVQVQVQVGCHSWPGGSASESSCQTRRTARHAGNLNRLQLAVACSSPATGIAGGILSHRLLMDCILTPSARLCMAGCPPRPRPRRGKPSESQGQVPHAANWPTERALVGT